MTSETTLTDVYGDCAELWNKAEPNAAFLPAAFPLLHDLIEPEAFDVGRGAVEVFS
jgi:hypothetical protein